MHRIDVAALPRAIRVDVKAPVTQGARHVVLDGERLVFTSRGHLMSEPASGGEATAIAAGVVENVWSQPICAHGKIIALRLDARGAPSRPRTVDVVAGPSVRAQTFGVSSRTPVAVALDVGSGDVHAIDLAHGTSRVVTKLETQQDPQVPGLIAVSDDGAMATLMLSSSAHGDAWLLEVDLVNNTALAIHPPVTKGWVTGTRIDGKRVIIEQTLGDEPVLRVLKEGRAIFTRSGAHPPSLPVRVTAGHLAFLACAEAGPGAAAASGDPQLIVVDDRGNFSSLAEVEGSKLRVVDGAILVEGGRSMTVVHLG